MVETIFRRSAAWGGEEGLGGAAVHGLARRGYILSPLRGFAVYFALLALSPFVMSIGMPDDMVFLFLVLALVGTIPLAMADRPVQRNLGWLATVTAIALSFACWSAGKDRLRSRANGWQAMYEKALAEKSVTSAPSADRFR